ncbi:MAG: hypothetical protein GXO64_03590, partial [Candidatus Micrarchaeota archaeon]|nr:hypothetical protein [Candidatus Micrarchaeota archaeon]
MKEDKEIITGIIKESLDLIEKEHKKNHISQIDNIIEYEKIMFPKKRNMIKFLKNILKLEERIFWCIDDIVDNQYDSQKMILFNEIAKFVSFIELFDKILTYQLKNKGDFSNLLFKKDIIAKKIISS